MRGKLTYLARPGNANTVTHGAFATLDKLPEGRAWLLPLLLNLRAEIAEDLGGWDALTGAQKVILALALENFKVAILLFADIAEKGTLDGTGSLRPATHRAFTYSRTAAEHLRTLGLGRVAQDLNDLDAVLRREASILNREAVTNGG
jgi:hypothetical protein